MAISLGNLLDTNFETDTVDAIEGFLRAARSVGPEIGDLITETIAPAGEAAGVDTAGLAGGFAAITTFGIAIAAVVALGAFVYGLQWLRGQADKLPFGLGGPFKAIIDIILQSHGSVANVVSQLLSDLASPAGAAVHSIFHGMGQVMHWTSTEVMHTTVNVYHEMANTVANEAKSLATSAQDLALNVRTELQSDVHGLWSRIHDLQIQTDTLQKLETKTETLAENTARQLVPILSQVPQLWSWAHYFYSSLTIIFTDIVIIKKDVNDLEKQVKQLEQTILILTEVVVPALATVETLSLLLPLTDAGEEGIRCLKESAIDCGRGEKAPEGDKCWLPGLISMAEKFRFADV